MAQSMLETRVYTHSTPTHLIHPLDRRMAAARSRSPPYMSVQGPSTLRYLLVSVFLLSIPFLVNYSLTWIIFHHAYLLGKARKRPPTFPHLVPLLGNTLSFVWDGRNFVRNATTYMGKQVPVGISILTDKIYLFQGAQAITDVWKQPSLTTAVYIHTMVLKQLFGMSPKSVDMYIKDDSGTRRKPNPGSHVQPHNRIEFLTHENLLKGLSGPGLNPSFSRYESLLARELDALDIGEEWQEMPDLQHFYQDHLTPPMLEALYGPTLLSVNPTLIRDLWAYDQVVKKLARRLPRFWIPSAYRLRDKVLSSVKRWHEVARSRFRPSDVYADGDGDPFWGSQLARSRQELLLGVDNLDFDSIASADLGLIWASFTSLIPMCMMAVLEIFRDKALVSRLRDSLQDTVKPTPELAFELRKVEQIPLLLSVYAETLRRLLTINITRCAPDHDISINNWLLPRNKVMIVGTYPAHMDPTVWNTKDGAHPLDKFWAERFLVYPQDPTSGPLKNRPPTAPSAAAKGATTASTDEPAYFSTAGLDGSFIPFGGGSRACPGRHLAKRQILLLCAMMVMAFDVEILADDKVLQLDDSCYGLGIMRPKGKVRFRIRRRSVKRDSVG